MTSADKTVVITCKQCKDYLQSLRFLFQKGGKYAKAVEKASYIENFILNNLGDPRSLNTTNHGETRIRNCIKYELPGACRLITIHDNGVVLFCFAGTHDDCDEWLNKNRGLRLTSNGAQLVATPISENASDEDTRISGQSALTIGQLYKKIQDDDFDLLMECLKPSLIAKLASLEFSNSEEKIYSLIKGLENTAQSNAIYDTFCLLRQDKIRQASERVKIFTGKHTTINELTDSEIHSLISSDAIKDIPANDPGHAKIVDYYLRNTGYMDWMLFLHPEQEDLVTRDYNGSAKLVGVSGSGKTCVIVKRAIRLAQKYQSEKILIITLNRSLARLIKNMVSAAAPPDLRVGIEVKAFFEVCRDYLYDLEPNNRRLYDDKTWKGEEHIDEIWSEFYRCELNNFDAELLLPLHDSLISRGINAEQYIREEFDWIRSAVTIENRNDYFTVERKGRSYPLDKPYRSLLLKGLGCWEQKMQAVGVTDYLGISSALSRHINKIKPGYRSILVDESQDFGTTELALIRKLVKKGMNDIFLSGDAAQKISYKHQSLRKAGIDIHKSRSSSILKNYRNSREVLQFANSVLWNNLTDEIFEGNEFELLDPEFADFSGSVPLVLKAADLSSEINNSYRYLQSQLCDKADKKGCIALCGYSLYELEVYAKDCDIALLNGSTDTGSDNIFLSDLEQTKGFEFDYVCIVGCNTGIMPNPFKPGREQIVDLARLYVTMTRAKLELIISYSSKISGFIVESSDFYLADEWENFLDHDYAGDSKQLFTPSHLDDIKNDGEEIVLISDMTGPQFLYREESIGLPATLIEKIRSRIKGKDERIDDRPVAWNSISDAVKDLDDYPGVRQIFGKDIDKLRELTTKGHRN